MAGGGVQSQSTQPTIAGGTPLASVINGPANAPAPGIDTSGWTQNATGGWADENGQGLPGGITPDVVQKYYSTHPPTVTPPAGPQKSPPAPGYVGTGHEGGGVTTQSPPATTDPWASIPVNPTPWNASTQAVTPSSGPNPISPSEVRGFNAGQSLTDFLKGFSTTYTRPHNYGDFTPPDQPPITTTDPTTHVVSPRPNPKPVITPGGGTPPGGGGNPPPRHPLQPANTTHTGRTGQAAYAPPTITPAGGGSSTPPAGATRVPVPSGLSQDLWQLPDGTRVRFPGYTG